MSPDVRRRSEDGASAVEYGMMVVAVAAVIAAVVFIIGGLVRDSFNGTCSEIDLQITATATSC